MNIIVAITSLTVLFTSLIIGHILLYLTSIKCNINSFYSVFVKLIIGLFSSILFFAIYKTRGNTVLWLGAILLIIIYILIRKNTSRKSPRASLKKEIKQINGYAILAIALFVLIFTGLATLLFYNKPFNNVPHGDYYYYSKLIYSMKINGAESNIPLINPFNKGTIGAVPYHFPELWLAVIISEVFGVLPLESIVVYVQVILSTILAIGIVALSRSITKSIIMSIIAVMSLFFGGIIFVNIIPQMNSFIDFGNVYSPKYAIIGIMFIWSAILFIKQNKLYYFPLLGLPIINIALAPAIFSSLIIFWILKSISDHSIKPYLAKISITFFMALLIALFYILQPAGVSGLMPITDILEIHFALPLKPIKIFMGAIFIIGVLHFLYFIPLLIPYLTKSHNTFLENLKQTHNLLQLFVIILFVSSGIWSIIHPMADSIQFHYLPSYLLLYIIIFILWSIAEKSIENSRWIKILFYIVCIGIIGLNFSQIRSKAFYRYTQITNNYSENYIKRISTKLKDNITNPIGVFITPKKYIKNSFEASPYWISNPQLDNIIGNFNMINLSSLDYEIAKDDLILEKRAHVILKKAPFSQYANQIKENSPLTAIDCIQYNYVIKNQVNYMIVYSKAKLPPIFNNIIDTVIIDKKSGEKFVTFKYE